MYWLYFLKSRFRQRQKIVLPLEFKKVEIMVPISKNCLWKSRYFHKRNSRLYLYHITFTRNTVTEKNKISIILSQSKNSRKSYRFLSTKILRQNEVSTRWKVEIYTKPAECVDIIHRTSQGFHSWCPGSTSL